MFLGKLVRCARRERILTVICLKNYHMNIIWHRCFIFTTSIFSLH